MIDWLFRLLHPAFRTTYTHPGAVLLAAAAATALGAWTATGLRINSDFSTLLPADTPSVQALQRLRIEMGGESKAAVLIESPSFEANRRFAEALVERVSSLRHPDTGDPYVTHVDYRRETDVLKNNALYFATPTELDSLLAYLERERRQARLEANPFYFDLDEEEAADSEAVVRDLEALYDELVAQEYHLSPDSTLLAVYLTPGGSESNLDYVAQFC